MKRLFIALALVQGLAFQTLKGVESSVFVSVPDQKMVLFQDGSEVGRYKISTSKFGLGDTWGSYATPVGRFQIAQKIGNQVPVGGVFKERHFTGEILKPNAPGRDPIVTRILWLKGLESRNSNSFKRCIYIHGTPEEKLLGQPVSWGCIRMRSKDVVELFDAVAAGVKVEILEKSVRQIVREQKETQRLAQNARGSD